MGDAMNKVIKNESEHQQAIAAIEPLVELDPDRGTPEADELELLTLLIQDYESRQVPASLPDPIEAIKFRMEQQQLTQRDLIPYIGSRSKVSEVLSGKRTLTLSMIRALHRNLGIPANVLLQERDPALLDDCSIDWNRYPIREIVSRGWIDMKVSDVRGHAEEIVREFFATLGGVTPAQALFRTTDQVRSARSMDEYALMAWSARVVIRAQQSPPPVSYDRGTVNVQFMREVAKLSWLDQGPLLAQEYLHKHGIPLVLEPHLPRTYLDGAAILIDAARPIIGLSLRHDRLDNFWYTLMHELAHIALHLDEGVVSRFFDDLDVDGRGNGREEEADSLAGESLIPEEAWSESPASRLSTPEAATRLAKQLGIHPAIVAGRMRYERKSYRILNRMVGHNQVRKHFTDVKWGR